MKAATGKPANKVGESTVLAKGGLVSEAKTAKIGRNNSSDKAVKKTIRRMRTSAAK